MLIDLLLSRFSCVRLVSTPWSVTLQAPLSVGFPRKEYWSGLPFPTLGDLPHSGIKRESPTLQAYSLLAEPPGNPNHTGVGSLSLLQGIFPTQKSNWYYLHCKADSQPLDYQGSPGAYFIPNSLYLFIPSPLPSPLVTTNLFFISVSLILFCYIH